ncbi:MAG: polysaccharide ABC transporter ATP-binding protein [Bacteroidota bacterium]
MNTETAIEVRGLSKEYAIGSNVSYTLRGAISNAFRWNKKKESFWALDDLTFEIKQGEAVGIIGHNGAGKSTLLKILSRITYPTKGSAILKGRVTSLLEVGTGFHPELTGSENIYLNGSLLGMSKSEIRSKFDEIVEFSGIEKFIYTPVKHYSSGMYVRLAFSVAAYLNTDILLVDEVLAVGDTKFQKKCLGKMDEVAHAGKTVIFVSHKEGAIRNLTSKVILLDCGKIAKIGTPDEVYRLYNETTINPGFKRYSEDSILKSVNVNYSENLNIEVEYKFEKENQMPHLGYVVSNSTGEKLFAGNPSIDGIKLENHYPKEGKVKIIVEQPRLKFGTYNVAIYFGNGLKDFIADENCVSFKVEDVNTNLGFIVPKNKYEFS